MKLIILCVSILATSFAFPMTAKAQGQRNQCVDRFNYVWGFDTSTNGRVKAGSTCQTSFSYGGAKTTGFRVVRNASNGDVKVSARGDGRASILYAPRKGFTGTDVFVVEIKGITVGRTGTENPEAATKITYNFTVQP
jgi:hypothetical protein